METTIRNWDDMRRFGIEILTGESCAYGLRLLCDLTEAGVRLLEDFLGNCVQFREGSNWNSRSYDKERKVEEQHVASVTLARGMLYDLAAFALLEEGHEVVLTLTEQIDGRPYRKVVAMSMKEWTDVRDVFNKSTHTSYSIFTTGTGPRRGGRNVHMMSGRAT